LRRVAALAPLVLATALLVMPAGAEIIHDETSQEAFGFDEIGSTVELAEGSDEFVQAWEVFSSTTEGARILGKLDANRDFEITIEVLPADEFKKGATALGVSRLGGTNDDGQREAKIIIRSTDTLGVDVLAETIYHEMRHVEVWVDGDLTNSDEVAHGQIDAGTDAGILRFRSQRDSVPIPTTAPPEAKTPIYKAVTSRFDDDFLLVESAKDCGSYL